MPRRDYLMRMLEQLQGLLPYILDLTKTGDFQEAHAVIDQAVRELIGIGTDGLLDMPEDYIVQALQAERTVAWEDKCLFLATMLYEEAEILDTEGESGPSYGRYVKALNLLLILALHDTDVLQQSELTPEIEEALDRLSEFHLPAQTSAYLVRYYEALGEFGLAEDYLFDWLEADPALTRPEDPNPVEFGLAFYERLSLHSDEALAAGNLTREELELARAELGSSDLQEENDGT